MTTREPDAVDTRLAASFAVLRPALQQSADAWAALAEARGTEFIADGPKFLKALVDAQKDRSLLVSVYCAAHGTLIAAVFRSSYGPVLVTDNAPPARHVSSPDKKDRWVPEPTLIDRHGPPALYCERCNQPRPPVDDLAAVARRALKTHRVTLST